MLEKSKRERIIALVNKEVVPAIGCTEPMAVALCTAKAATTLGNGAGLAGFGSHAVACP